MTAVTCDDCVFLKTYPKERDKLLNQCQNINVYPSEIKDLRVAETCPHFDEDSWVK